MLLSTIFNYVIAFVVIAVIIFLLYTFILLPIWSYYTIKMMNNVISNIPTVPQQTSEVVPPEIIPGGFIGKKQIDNIFSRQQNIDKFTGDLPNKVSQDLIEDDYSSAIKNMSLESSVIAGHNKYASERNHVASTSRSTSVRDDPNDINPWVGLSRPDYHRKSMNTTTAKETPSDLPDQLTDYKQLSWK